jgi:aldehyde:ferredoxin oxidoreductase
MPVFGEALDHYYELMGWDKDGIPLPETLAAFGL